MKIIGHLVYSKEVKKLRSTKVTKSIAAVATPAKRVRGIKGPISLFNYVLDVIRSTVIDDLHCVYLGVTRTFINLWFDPQYARTNWSLSKIAKVVDDCLHKIKPPAFVK